MHKPTHPETDNRNIAPPPKKDRPGTTQRVPKVDFNGFENDPEFLRLLDRYPLLKSQLSTVYGLTLEPGLEDSKTWNRGPLPFALEHDSSSIRESRSRGSFRGARGSRGSRGRGGWNRFECSAQEEREHGRWTQEKGDREAMKVIAKIREGSGNAVRSDDATEGMREFIELVMLRFGDRANAVAD